MRRIALLAVASLLSAGLAAAQPAAQTPAEPSVGQTAFANSGAPQAQAAFQRGVALLHNFEYPRAIDAFQEAQKADPGFAMAYWGEAMAHNHPVWMEQDEAKARAALARLAATPAERLARARTDRERGFLEAVETLYGEGSKEARDHAYNRRMEALFKAHPGDVDVASLYALSVLGLAHQGRDFGLFMRSAGILEEFFPTHPRHPGVLHYLIHSYDDPVHAPLGIRAARLYGKVAPDAAHALHMTSHIFVALGDWKPTIDSNLAAMAAVDSQRAAAKRPPARCGHYLEWLNYAYYQTGEPDRSNAIRQGCRTIAQEEVADGEAKDRFATPSYLDMWLRNIVEADGREPALDLGPARTTDERFTLAYGALLAARGRGPEVAAAHGLLKQSASAAKADADAHLARRREIVLAQAAGLEELSSKRVDAGLERLRQAAEKERAMAPEFGPPLIEKPSFELLGEEYLRLGRTREAAEAFRAALKLAPGRRLSLAGLAKAEAAATSQAGR